MSNIISEKEWIKWNPEKIYLKNIKNDITTLTYSNRFLKENNFYKSLGDNKINENKKDDMKLEQISSIKKNHMMMVLKKDF